MRQAVSVVVPNYNHASLIGEALNSITHELHPGDQLIVIDDTSTDNSVEIIEKMLNGRQGATFIQHTRNMGVIPTLNEGLALAEKEFVCFPGADDVVLPGAFGKALPLLAEYPAAAFCSGRAQIIGRDSAARVPFPTRNVLSEEGYLSREEVERELLKDDAWLVGLTFYRTELLREIGGFRTSLGSFADGFASRHLALRHGCCFIPAPLHLWRRVDDGYSSMQNADYDEVIAIGECAMRLMDSEFRDDFPRGYSRRWRARWHFGARHFSIRTRQTSRWRPLLERLDTRSGSYRLFDVVMAASRVPAILVLFLKYRWWDVVPVLRRRLKGRG